MAFMIPRSCSSCGKKYVVYFPYRMLIKEQLGQGTKDIHLAIANEIDHSPMIRKELRLAKQVAESLDYEFRDAGINEIIQCECGEIMDLLEQISKREI